MSKRFYATVAFIVLLFMAAIVQALIAPSTFINGAGASFPYPLYSKWIKTYYKLNPQTKINYQSIGSGGGIRQTISSTVDFGATDAPMNEHEIHKAKHKILHIPTVLGAVAVTYNLPELKNPLKLNSEVLVNIYLGEIKKWNHPMLVSLNPELKNNDTHVLPIRRSDGSGTTSVFTDYLSKVSSIWKAEVGQGKSLKWPTGLGGKGNEGVTGLVKQNHGAIGYVELSFAISGGLPVAYMQNAAGNYILPSLESVSLSADGVIIPEDYRVSITDSQAEKAYPITSFTYILIPENLSKKKKKAMVGFLNWALTEGQSIAPTLKYAPLPQSLVTRLQNNLKQLEINK